jgi:hypothetical protein
MTNKMSIITKFGIGTEILNLENNIKILTSLNDLISFKKIIMESIKSLSSVNYKITNNYRLSGIIIPKELLINIMSFLPCDCVANCGPVSMSWLKILKSAISKKIIFPTPKKLNYVRTLNIGLALLTITRVRDDIYYSNPWGSYSINLNDYRKMKVMIIVL